MIPTYSGEVQFCGFTDSTARGPVISFRLHDASELEAFRGDTVARKGVVGQRYAMVLVRILDDESLEGDLPLPPKSAADLVDDMEEREAKKRSGFPNGLTGLSVIWCKDSDFHSWLEAETGVPVADEQTARDLVCSLCGIESRKELETNESARATFEEIVRAPYAASRKERGMD